MRLDESQMVWHKSEEHILLVKVYAALEVGIGNSRDKLRPRAVILIWLSAPTSQLARERHTEYAKSATRCPYRLGSTMVGISSSGV